MLLLRRCLFRRCLSSRKDIPGLWRATTTTGAARSEIPIRFLGSGAIMSCDGASPDTSWKLRAAERRTLGDGAARGGKRSGAQRTIASHEQAAIGRRRSHSPDPDMGNKEGDAWTITARDISVE
jgi:hypothetical protein